MLTFWLYDVCTNILEPPLRALISDTIEVEHHPNANALFTAANGNQHVCVFVYLCCV